MGAAIAGVRVDRLDPHDDERGTFMEIFASHWGNGVDPTQWSLVRSHAGVLRGMHLHLRHDELLTVTSGVLWVGLYDLRGDSVTAGTSQLIRLSGDEPATLAFPRGLVHGWLAQTPVTHLQAVSESYVDYASDDNLGCRWDDPHLALDWPITPRITSPRSDGFGSLNDLRAVVAANGGGPVATALDAAAR